MSEINQTNSSKEKPTLVITTGDEAGIGPEIIQAFSFGLEIS